MPSRIDVRAALLCTAAALLAGLVYSNALHNPFVYDDYHTVVENPSILPSAPLTAVLLYDVKRPVVNASYALDRARAGPTPSGFHITNVLLHIVNVVLLFQLARRLREDESPLVPFTAAVLFAVHPMMTEAVGYISGRSELLCATFVLAAVLFGLRWMRGGGLRMAALMIGCWALALASKETAAMLPFLLIVVDWVTAHGTPEDRRRRFRTVHLPLVTFAVAAGFVRLFVLMRIEYPGQMYVHPQYALLALDVVVRYLRLMVMPAGQTIFHSVSAVESVADVRVIAAVVVIGVLLTLAWRLRFSQGMAAMGILWFFLLLVPAAVLTVLDSGEPMAEHRVYVASCGLFLAAASAIGWLYERLEQETERAAAIAGSFVIIVVAAMSVQTVMRNAVWSDPVRLWKESVDLAPAHYRPRLLLGEALQDQGRRAEAVTEYETAVRLNPSNVMGYMKLGTCLAELGDIERARTAYRRAASLQPSYEPAQRALALMQQVQPK